MTAVSRHQNTGIPPRKVRLVANLVRGMATEQALRYLANLPQKSTQLVRKTLLAATSNWYEKHDPNNQAPNLYIKEIRVNGGTMLKRSQPAAKGRALPIKKRSSHIEIVVAEKSEMPLGDKKGTKKKYKS